MDCSGYAARKLSLIHIFAEQDDALMEKYLMGEELTIDEIKTCIRKSTINNTMVCLLYTSRSATAFTASAFSDRQRTGSAIAARISASALRERSASAAAVK